MENVIIHEIVNAFGLPSNPRNSPISKNQIKIWMDSPDIEVLGALYAFISKRQNWDKINPSLSKEEWISFVLNYFDRCLMEDVDGEWAHGRYPAAWEVASWFCALWKSDDDRELLHEIKEWLGTLYKNGNIELRRSLIDGALEHMFEKKSIRRFFADWKQDAELMHAFAEACDWS